MMHKRIDFSPYKSVLCLNGILPDPAFFLDLNLPIIAADGAANTLHVLGLEPQIIIGDLDSVHDSIRGQNRILHRPEQNSCDYQKSLDYLKEHNLLPSIVVGMNGGFLDHILNNINIFIETDSILYDPPLIGYALKAKTKHRLELPKNTKISLIGIPNARISSKGLKWDLNNTQLHFPGKSSCFNRTQESQIEIQVLEGSVLILIYMQPMPDAGSEVDSAV